MSRRLRVKTPQGMGFVLDTTPLAVQLARGQVGVILDRWHGPMPYFAPHEVEVWAATRYPLITHSIHHGLTSDHEHAQKKEHSA